MTASIWNPGSSTTTSTPATVPFSFVKGTEANPGINFVGDTDTGIWSQADGYLNFVVNGVSKLSISPTGEVTANEFVTGVEIDVASAATVDIGAVQSNSIRITGTSTITSFGTTYQGPKFIRFAGALTLTNSSTLICPGGSNISISAGDTMIVVPKATAGVSDGWVVVSYIKSVAATDLSNTVRVDVVSAATTSLLYTSIGSRNIRLTGTATIATFTADAGGLYFVTFGGAITLTNSASIVTNIGGDIKAQAGDTCILRATAYSVVEVVSYVPAALGSISQGGQLGGFRNRIINGGMRVNQYGVKTLIANYQLATDRWWFGVLGGTSISGNITNTSGIAGFSTLYSYGGSGLNFTTGTPTWMQRIESANVYDLNSKTVTVSGQIYQDTGSNQGLSISLWKATALDNFTTTTQIGSTNTANTATTGVVTNFTATFTLGSSDATNGIELRIGTTGSITAVSKSFYIGAVQLEVGTVATSFEQRPIGLELSLCQRYYFQLNGNAAGGGINWGGFTASASLSTYGTYTLPVTMRITPFGGGSPGWTTTACSVSAVNVMTPNAFVVVAALSNTPNLQASYYLTSGTLTFTAEL